MIGRSGSMRKALQHAGFERGILPIFSLDSSVILWSFGVWLELAMTQVPGENRKRIADNHDRMQEFHWPLCKPVLKSAVNSNNKKLLKFNHVRLLHRSIRHTLSAYSVYTNISTAVGPEQQGLTDK